MDILWLINLATLTMNKLFLFLTKILLTITVVILAKTMFLCWYHDNFTFDYFINYTLNISNAFIAIGYLISNLLNNLLSKTLFAINFKDIIKLLFNDNSSTSEGKFSFKHFSKDKLLIGGPDEPLSSNIKLIKPKKGDYLMSENNSEVNKASSSSTGDLNRNVPELVNFDKLDRLMAETKRLMLDMDSKHKKIKNSSSSLMETSTIKEEIKSPLPSTSTIKEETKSPLSTVSTDKTISKLPIETTNTTNADLNKLFDDLVDFRNSHILTYLGLINLHVKHYGFFLQDVVIEAVSALNSVNNITQEHNKALSTISFDDPESLKKSVNLNNNTFKKNMHVITDTQTKLSTLVKDYYKQGHVSKESYDWYDETVRKQAINVRQNFMTRQNKLSKELNILINNKKK